MLTLIEEVREANARNQNDLQNHFYPDAYFWFLNLEMLTVTEALREANARNQNDLQNPFLPECIFLFFF